MKTPLRFQVTEFDCGTISLLNALSFLFERNEIPAELIKAIHRYTLDCYDQQGHLGQGGTSRDAIEKLTHWITRFANSNNFNIVCEHLEGEEVSLEKMIGCLQEGGCILIRCWQLTEHYVLITKIDKKKAYIFDPYYLPKNVFDKDKDVKIILNKPFTHKRLVSLKRLFSETNKDFALGPVNKRECVLIDKID